MGVALGGCGLLQHCDSKGLDYILYVEFQLGVQKSLRDCAFSVSRLTFQHTGLCPLLH